jgi:hypothetical protein
LISGSYSEPHFPSTLTKCKVDIKFINKEHFFYWRIYNEVVGEIPKASPSAPSPANGEGAEGEVKSCPCCGAAMGMYHCPTCGFSRPLL